MHDDRAVAIRMVIGRIAPFVVLGAALIAYLWETLNELLAGHVDGRRLLLALPALLVFVLVLNRLARVVQRLDAAPQPAPRGERAAPHPGLP